MQELIEIIENSCYTVYAFPPIFRDGARGGLAASAFNKGEV